MNEHQPLPSWNEGAAKAAILAFVALTQPGASFVPPAERLATFDADGTLWCEQPMPVQARLHPPAAGGDGRADPELRAGQPWKSAYEHDNDWLGKVITEHYAGDDTKAQAFSPASPPCTRASASRTSRHKQTRS